MRSAVEWASERSPGPRTIAGVPALDDRPQLRGDLLGGLAWEGPAVDLDLAPRGDHVDLVSPSDDADVDAGPGEQGMRPLPDLVEHGGDELGHGGDGADAVRRP